MTMSFGAKFAMLAHDVSRQSEIATYRRKIVTDGLPVAGVSLAIGVKSLSP
ncbi:MAG: hypothetical protein ACKN9W_09415 [Methylococcus sp.]